MKFSRYSLWSSGKTWAFHKFRRHHTELNDLYWTYAPAAHHSQRHIKVTSAAALVTPAVAFNYSKEVRRVPSTTKEWQENFRDFDNWVRLSSLMSLAAYLEVYVRSVVSLAIESDPGVLIGKHRAVDGVSRVWL